MDQNIKVSASLQWASSYRPSFHFTCPLSSSCRALWDLSNQWWTRMLWCQERRAIKQPIQRDSGKKWWILSQDVAHSFISNKTVQQQTQTVCSGTDSLTYSSHSLSSTERHCAELQRRQPTGGTLDQWGMTTKGQCQESSSWPTKKTQLLSDVTETGCFYPPLTSCKAFRVKFKKMGLNPNKDTNTAFYWLKGCKVTSISHTILYTVF